MSSLLPQECKDSIRGECNSLKHHFQEEGVHKHTLEPKSCGNSESIEEIDGVIKGATSSFDSPPHEGNKGERGKYKSGSKHIPFDFAKHGNFHISMGKELHVPFVVWITIMFLDVGREWPHTGNF